MRIPDDEWIPAKDKAAEEGETMTDVIRRALRRYVIGAVIMGTVLALSGCGGSWASWSGTAKGVDHTSAAAIAAALDAGGFACTGWTPNVGVIGAREDGYCTHGEGTVSVTTFNSADQLRTTNAAFAAFTTSVPVYGETWQVSAGDEVQATAVQKILGGAIQ